MSAIGSVIMAFRRSVVLPAGLTNTGDQTLVGVFAETNTAQSKLAIDRTGSSAELAPVFATGTELRVPIRLGDF